MRNKITVTTTLKNKNYFKMIVMLIARHIQDCFSLHAVMTHSLELLKVSPRCLREFLLFFSASGFLKSLNLYLDFSEAAL